jgi:hypothetical protein
MGTTSTMGGSFTLTQASTTTATIPFDTATKHDVYTALTNAGITVSNVKQYSYYNTTKMFLVEFPVTAGNVDQLSVDTSAMTGTNFNGSVQTYKDGAYIGGTFQLYMSDPVT